MRYNIYKRYINISKSDGLTSIIRNSYWTNVPMCWQATEKLVFLSNECVDELADNRKISHKEGSILYCGVCTSFFKFN